MTFFRPVFPRVFIDLYRVSYSERINGGFEEYDGFSRQIMLAQQTKLRVENFCIFFLVRNDIVINDTQVIFFDP